jgi:hypothetical protein
MGVLNNYMNYLPMLKNSPKAVARTKEGNVLFSKVDLATIILAFVQITQQNQYNLMLSIASHIGKDVKVVT